MAHTRENRAGLGHPPLAFGSQWKRYRSAILGYSGTPGLLEGILYALKGNDLVAVFLLHRATIFRSFLYPIA